MSSGELDCIGNGESADVDNALSELGLAEDKLLLEGVRGLRHLLCVGDVVRYLSSGELECGPLGLGDEGGDDDGVECSEFWPDESDPPEDEEL